VSGVVRYRVLISGRVQGVFFRDTCRRMAERHSVSGWVRNLPDGSVEAVFEGSAEEVRRLVEWSRHGPRSAVVEDVRVRAEPPEGISGFQIKLGDPERYRRDRGRSRRRPRGFAGRQGPC
jgi:acylphosphatase